MALVKREKTKKGVKILAYGEAASGKSPFGLSFPNTLLFDPDTSTTFYEGENVVMEGTALNLAEMLEDLTKVDRDKSLLSDIHNIVIDSMTRYTDKLEQAALTVAEKRARRNGRDAEGESISPKERNNMKINYERAFSKLMEYVLRGKGLVVIAEQKDKTENKTNPDGSNTFIKTGVVPNMPKDSDYDFDIVIHTFKKDGKTYGTIEKDRTGTFEVGAVVERPNYSHWEKAIKKAQTGRELDESEIRKFDEVVAKEAETFADLVEKAHSRMKEICIAIKDEEFKKQNVTPLLQEKMGTANFPTVIDLVKLNAGLEALEVLYEEYKNKQ